MATKVCVGTTMPAFADRLKMLREKAGLTQEALATRAGLHRVAVARLETGKREPAWGTVQALARALGVSIQAFDDYPGVEGTSTVEGDSQAEPEDEPPATKKRRKGEG